MRSSTDKPVLGEGPIGYPDGHLGPPPSAAPFPSLCRHPSAWRHSLPAVPPEESLLPLSEHQHVTYLSLVILAFEKHFWFRGGQMEIVKGRQSLGSPLNYWFLILAVY